MANYKKNKGESRGRQNIWYVPNSNCIVFEDMRSHYDQIGFKEYTDECHLEDEKEVKSEPFIISQSGSQSQYSSDSQSLAQEKFKEAFDRQLSVLRKKFEAGKHGEIRLAARFGRLYTWNTPPFALSLQQFNEMCTHPDKRERIKSAFIPSNVDEMKVLAALRNLGFTESDVQVEEWYVQVLTQDLSKRPTVRLDEKFEFKEISSANQKWLRVDVKCAGSHDVRFVVQTILPVDPDDSSVDEFRNRPIIAKSDDSDWGLEICHHFRKRVHFVRHKKERTFSTSPPTSEVVARVVTAREYSVEADGAAFKSDFARMSEDRCEVVFHPTVQNLDDEVECETVRDAFWQYTMDFAKSITD